MPVVKGAVASGNEALQTMTETKEYLFCGLNLKGSSETNMANSWFPVEKLYLLPMA